MPFTRDRPSETKVGGYKLGEELGRGASGVVYAGLSLTTGETVAIKEISLSKLNPKLLADTKTEVEMLTSLSNPNIVRCAQGRGIVMRRYRRRCANGLLMRGGWTSLCVDCDRYIDSVRKDDYLYIIMERVHNGSLANLVKEFGVLPESLVAVCGRWYRLS